MQRLRLIAVVLLMLPAGCLRQVPPPATGAACLAELDRRGIDWQMAATEVANSACTVATPVRVSAASIAWNQSGIVACRFALTLDDFAREDVEPLARAYFGEPVREIRHFGTYACRPTRAGKPSLHAHGEAIDIAGFELEDGTVISVEHDWRGAGVRSDFLHAVVRAACRRFSMVLTPDSNRDHYNHLHLDSGPYRECG